MKKSFNKILVGSAIMFTAAACTGDYLDINSNQFQPGDLSADGYLLASSMGNMCGAVVPSDVNCNQFTDCLLGGTLGGYFSDGNHNFTTSFARNCAPNNWSSVFLTDSKIISTLYTNYANIEGYCDIKGTVVPVAIAKIIRVASMDRVTDTYGPIPFTQIGVDGVIKTPYDSQEDVYKAFFKELAEARQMLQENLDNTTDVVSSIADKVYGGDKANWIRFCNSLQLRLAMRIVYADRTLAKQKAEEAVNPANGGVIETNDQNATWKNYASSQNAMRTAIMYNSQDSRPSAEIVCYLKGYNDPRIASYLTSANSDNTSSSIKLLDSDGNPVDYAGVRRGWASFAEAWGLNCSGINIGPNSPALWQNASEVCFLRAEGVAVFGFDLGGTAESFYNKGIELSFEDCGVADGYAAYVADATSVPARYYDANGANPWNGTLDPVTIAWDESLSAEAKQQKIITQKWLANWLLGNEAWADYRRTGYPDLIPVAYNGSNVVDVNYGPRRMAYPADEYTNNLANVQIAVSDYLKGADNIGTRVWWDCKPGL